jgi:hypothetical protein
MMDIECPYCGKGLNIDHDCGFGYEEGVTHQMECDHCGKSFVFTTHIMYSYEAEKADCLNGGEHDYQLSHICMGEYSLMRCSMCDHDRDLTEDEKLKFKIGTKRNYID